MKFCHHLCNAVNFEPEAVQPCCNVHWLSVPRFPFSGGPLDMPAYAAHIRKVVGRMQSGELCAGCPELLDDVAAPGAEHPLGTILFRTVSLNMHRHMCDCRCVYCDLWRGGTRAYPVLPALRSLAAQQVLHPDCVFSWGGGEPGILPEFEEAGRWILENGWAQYVHTNALRCSPAIEAVLRAGMGAVNVSLDSGTPATYRAVKGVDGFARVTDTLARYRAAAGEDVRRITAKYIVFEINNAIPEIERFFEICAALDIRSVQFSLDFREVNGAGPSAKTLLAAAFFRHRALAAGMWCEPFFIDAPWLARIEDLGARHFGTPPSAS